MLSIFRGRGWVVFPMEVTLRFWGFSTELKGKFSAELHCTVPHPHSGEILEVMFRQTAEEVYMRVRCGV